MKTNFILLLIAISTVAKGQPIPEFSDLSSRPMVGQTGFHSLQTSDCMFYAVRKPDLSSHLYKVNFDGLVVDSTELNMDGYIYTGELYTSAGRFFFIGNAYKPFVSWVQSYAQQRRSIVEFDENLNIINVNLYDLMPPGAGSLSAYNLQVGTGSTLAQPLDAHHLKGDTMMMTREYVFFDTATFIPTSRSQRLEKVVLDDTFFLVKSIGQYIDGYRGAAIFDDSIYVYASASECCANALFDFTNLGVFNANGDWVRKIALLPQPNGLIDVAYDANGLSMNGKIFTSYTDRINAYSPSCESAVIDIRDTTFNLLRLAKTPLCEFYPAGTKCFAEVDNTIYFQTRNSSGDIGLFKYDTLLNLQWSEVYDFDEPHLGVSVNATPDGGCILECVVNQNILKLYKINPAGDIVSFSSFPFASVSVVKVFPNPFAEWINIEGISEQDARIEIYDTAGRLCQTAALNNQSVPINSELPSGVYVLTVRSAKSNRVLHSQKIVKQ